MEESARAVARIARNRVGLGYFFFSHAFFSVSLGWSGLCQSLFRFQPTGIQNANGQFKTCLPKLLIPHGALSLGCHPISLRSTLTVPIGAGYSSVCVHSTTLRGTRTTTASRLMLVSGSHTSEQQSSTGAKLGDRASPGTSLSHCTHWFIGLPDLLNLWQVRRSGFSASDRFSHAIQAWVVLSHPVPQLTALRAQ